MKILLMGDASNYHCTLAKGLARMGHSVTVASNGSHWMRTGRDIDLSRMHNRLGGAILWAKLNTVLRNRISGYDVVQIHNPVFVELMPHRVRSIFDMLKMRNGSIFLTALGTDSAYVDMCLSDECPLRYTDMRVGSRPTPGFNENQSKLLQWLQPPLLDHCRYVYDNVDGVVSALYEYHLSAGRFVEPERLAYGGIPIDIESVKGSRESRDERREKITLVTGHSKVNIMCACHKGREAEKGMDLMWPAIKAVADRYPDRVNARMVQNVPYAEFERLLDEAHIVVDQLYAYTPATTALLAMARGKLAVTGGEEEYYRFIGEDSLRPIINPDPENPASLTDKLARIVIDGELFHRMSVESRQLVEKHNDNSVVAHRFTDFWERRLACK